MTKSSKNFKADLGTQLAQTFQVEQQGEMWRLCLRRLAEGLAQGGSCVSVSAEKREYLQTVEHVSESGSTPFVLDELGFYIQRYWLHEVQLSQRLKQMALNTQTVEVDLTQIFADEFQRQAAHTALNQQFAIITGGPGTGKTTTVVKILALLLGEQPEAEIALAAPTGKAAQRLSESIQKGKTDEQFVTPFFSEVQLNSVPSEAKTLHRLLGVKPFTPAFRHDADTPLSADIVVVDEASMIDLALMNRLLQALKPSAKLILIGDADQLASVESGQVLADISKALSNNRAHLHNTFRFGGQIGELAKAINTKDGVAAKAILALNDSTVQRLEKDPMAFAKQAYQAYFDQVAEAADVASIFKVFNEFQVLCATRSDKAKFDYLQTNDALWYAGRPVMIRENHPEQGLYNGDIGICLPNEHDELKVYFEIEGQFKALMPARLPAHETAYAMTIHKSQGSEFDHVLIVLPEPSKKGDVNAMLTKELLYTAITRAKKQVTLVAQETVLERTIQQTVERQSGLKERLETV